MTPATYWVVRNGFGDELVETVTGLQWFTDGGRFASRSHAEGLAARINGHVIEVTERPVGLRWQEPADSMTMLLDGDRLAAIVDDVTFTVSLVGDTVHRVTPFGTLDAAKAAAEEAVRSSWT